MSRYSEQLEHEAEATRWQVMQTLEELRSRITPGQVIDQVVDYARDGGAAEMMRNFGRQVRDNPLPLTLIGAGIAWLMVGNGHARTNGGDHHSAGYLRRRMRNRTAGAAGALGETAHHTKERAEAALDRATGVIGDAATSAQDAADSAWHRTSGAASDTATAVRDTAASTYRRVARGTGNLAGRMGDSTMAAARGTAATGRTMLDFCREQPLVLAGLGLAVGAAIGALMPQAHPGNGQAGDEHAHDDGRSISGHSEDHGDGQHRPEMTAGRVDNPAAAPEAMPGAEEKRSAGTTSLVTDGESG